MYEVYNANTERVECRVFATELWAEVEVWLERDYEVFVDHDHMMVVVTKNEWD